LVRIGIGFSIALVALILARRDNRAEFAQLYRRIAEHEAERRNDDSIVRMHGMPTKAPASGTIASPSRRL
jgi:hypothetical protein